MTVTEALKSVRHVNPAAPLHRVRVACGFTTVHLQIFLTAYLQQRVPDRRVEISEGLFGDIAGTLEASESGTDAQGLAVLIEWADLDARLGYRGSGAWTRSAIPDIILSAGTMLDRIAASIHRQPKGLRIAVSLPTLPLPPLFHPPGWQAPEVALRLEARLAEFAAAIAGRAMMVNRQRLDLDSAPAQRYDLKSDLVTGAPWSVAHSDATAATLARLLSPAAPKKGIITDLDNTLWAGIVGADGPENVSWSLTGHSQFHGVYQNLLASLADQGVLIAVASKNDPGIAGRALARTDLLIRCDRMFPLEIHWNSKSASVSRILEVWNIAANSVIFVDDSPTELAEVAAIHPDLECIRFPEKVSQESYQLLWRLRDLCGKEFVSEDDNLRLNSIRQAVVFREGVEDGAAKEQFLKDAGAVFTIDLKPDPGAKRVLELVNKTNQFNLNGTRLTEADWAEKTAAPGAFVAAIQYADKFGPLGLISVAQGRISGTTLTVDCWVMSCRAFARRIEFQCLRVLFEQFDVAEIQMNYVPTDRNGPVSDFSRTFISETPEGPFAIGRELFETKCPTLYHEKVILNGDRSDG